MNCHICKEEIGIVWVSATNEINDRMMIQLRLCVCVCVCICVLRSRIIKHRDPLQFWHKSSWWWANPSVCAECWDRELCNKYHQRCRVEYNCIWPRVVCNNATPPPPRLIAVYCYLKIPLLFFSCPWLLWTMPAPPLPNDKQTNMILINNSPQAPVHQ